jgi:hypothetical protein
MVPTGGRPAASMAASTALDAVPTVSPVVTRELGGRNLDCL